MIFNIHIARSGVTQVVFINEIKSCKLANIFECNVFIFENKGQTGYDINIGKQKYLLAPFCMVCLMNQSHI